MELVITWVPNSATNYPVGKLLSRELAASSFFKVTLPLSPLLRHNPRAPFFQSRIFAFDGGFCDQSSLEFHRASRRIPHLHLHRRITRRIHRPRHHPRRAVRTALWRGHRLRRPARRSYGFGLDPHLRAFHQHPSRLWPLHHSRKQHRANHRLRRRIARRRRHVHHSRADLSRLWQGVHFLAHFPARASRRMARRSLYGPDSPPAHRQRARQPFLS